MELLKEGQVCNRNGTNRYTQLLAQRGIQIEDTKKIIIERDPYTVAVLEYGGVRGWGFAKRCPRDKPNKALGESIAYGRALKDLWSRWHDRDGKTKGVENV